MDDLIETPNPNQASNTEPKPDPGSDEEAVNAFAKSDGDEDDADATGDEQTEQPEDGSDTDASEEASDGEPDDEAAPEGTVEVEFEGKTYNVAPELQKALLRQADYSRSMNEVGTLKKDYTQRLETADKLIEGAEKFAEALAEVNTIERQLKSYEKVDWPKLRADDPAEFAAAAAEMQMLRLSRDDAMQKARQIDGALQKERATTTDAARADMLKKLVKDLPGWGEALGTKVTQYAMSTGYSAEEIKGFADARLVITLDKARKFDALQAAKGAVKAKAKDAPPVVKPGAQRPRVDKKSTSMAELRRSGSLDAAAKAFEARM